MRTTLTFLLTMLTFGVFAQSGWFYLNPDLGYNQYGAIYATNEDTLLVMADNGIFSKTVDGGITWNNVNTGFTESFFDLAFINADTGYAVGQNGKILKSTNGGTTWISLPSGVSTYLYSVCIHSANDIWVVGDSGVLLHSTDYGTSWDYRNPVAKGLYSIGFKGDLGIVTGEDGTILVSSDNGGHWVVQQADTTLDIFSLCITPNLVYALGGSTNHMPSYGHDAEIVMRTTDFATWSYFELPDIWAGATAMAFVNDSTGFTCSSVIIVKNYGGIMIQKTTDSAATWNVSMENWDSPYLLSIGYSDLAVVNDTVSYALCGGNILKTITGGYSGISNALMDQQAAIYPNPLTGSLLQVRLPESRQITVELFDITGKRMFSSSFQGSEATVDLSSLRNGFYLVKLWNGSSLIALKKLTISR
ncbi:MAG TPA: YCF48-related protein [Bacteroidales bacterium]|nr:YCF48-related protein [Bacteroidales bacterium]HPS74142.1 YCF48-related protein [Bacteroidales bacterium]